MIDEGTVVACVVCGLVGLFAGTLFGWMSDGSVRRWIELRHEYRMKQLAQKDRWLDVEAARPRPGEWRTEVPR